MIVARAELRLAVERAAWRQVIVWGMEEAGLRAEWEASRRNLLEGAAEPVEPASLITPPEKNDRELAPRLAAIFSR